MWDYRPTDRFVARAKQYAKKQRREFVSVIDNLDTFRQALLAGARVADIHFGFIHAEPKGVKAVVQTGPKNLKPTRLYIYPDAVERVIHQITLGDKNTQQDDIQFCNAFVDALRNAEKEAP